MINYKKKELFKGEDIKMKKELVKRGYRRKRGYITISFVILSSMFIGAIKYEMTNMDNMVGNSERLKAVIIAEYNLVKEEGNTVSEDDIKSIIKDAKKIDKNHFVISYNYEDKYTICISKELTEKYLRVLQEFELK